MEINSVVMKTVRVCLEVTALLGTIVSRRMFRLLHKQKTVNCMTVAVLRDATTILLADVSKFLIWISNY